MKKENNNEIEKNVVVTPETIEVFATLAVTLKRIHVRLIAEGYIVKDGRKIKSEKLLEMENSTISSRKSRSRKN